LVDPRHFGDDPLLNCKGTVTATEVSLYTEQYLFLAGAKKPDDNIVRGAQCKARRRNVLLFGFAEARMTRKPGRLANSGVLHYGDMFGLVGAVSSRKASKIRRV
jgi:hypothetical protein